MKNVKFIFVALFILLIVLPSRTLADTYITNNNGIEISKEDYDNFLKVKPHEYIMVMNEEEYQKLKSLDYSNVQTETKYIETVYNSKLNLTTEKEITEEAFESNIMPILDTDTAYSETVHKKISLTLASGSYWNYVTFTARWKGAPAVRSFDVIGIRLDGAELRNGSQTGEQIYSENDVFSDITYAWNGTNIKRFGTTGFGISMNVVNNANLQSLVMTIDCDITPTKDYTYVFGSYQHAVTNVSLAESQNYVMSLGGLGDIFEYPFETSQKYDGMHGVHLHYINS